MLITTQDRNGLTIHIVDTHVVSIVQSAHGDFWVNLSSGIQHTLDAAHGRDLVDALAPSHASSLAVIRRSAMQTLQNIKDLNDARRQRDLERNGQ
jgi:hypothetical protein